jgi:hypothetical protein
MAVECGARTYAASQDLFRRCSHKILGAPRGVYAFVLTNCVFYMILCLPDCVSVLQSGCVLSDASG